MRILFILILFSVNACSFNGKPSSKNIEANIEAEIDNIMLEEEPLSEEEINRYFADLSNRYKKVYLTKSRKEALGKEISNGLLLGNHQPEKAMVMELLFSLANSKLPYCFHITQDSSEAQMKEILKKSLKKIKKIKTKDLDFSYMHLVNYYTDAHLFSDEKKYLSLAENLYEKLLDNLTDREGFFLSNRGASSSDVNNNSYALLTTIKLYRNTLDLRYLEKATRLNDQILSKLNTGLLSPELLDSQLYLYNFTHDLSLLENARYFADLILKEPDSFRTAEYARFMNFLYYFLPEQLYKDFANETLEKLIKEQIKAEQKNYYSLLLLKAELSSKPVSFYLKTKNLRDDDSLDLLRDFLKQRTNYYLLDLVQSD